MTTVSFYVILIFKGKYTQLYAYEGGIIMKAFKHRLTAFLTGAAMMCSLYSAPTVSAIGKVRSELPPASTLTEQAARVISAAAEPVFELNGLSKEIYCGYYVTVLGNTEQYEKLELDMEERAASGLVMAEDHLTLYVNSQTPAVVFLDTSENPELLDTVTFTVKSAPSEDFSAEVKLYGWRPEVRKKTEPKEAAGAVPSTTTTQNGNGGPPMGDTSDKAEQPTDPACTTTTTLAAGTTDGTKQQPTRPPSASQPENKPDYAELRFIQTPRRDYTVGSLFECTKYYVWLVEVFDDHFDYYDVSDYIYTTDHVYLDEVGQQTACFKTSYRTEYGSGMGLTLKLDINVLPIGGTGEAYTAGSEVTSAQQDPYYSPFFTDENGNTYNRGTNACCGYYLYIVRKGRTEFAVGEELDTTGLQVFLVEDRSWNDVYYDVTSELTITSNYDPNTPGEYEVSVFTEYAGKEGKAEKPVTYTVTVNPEMTTGPIQQTSLPWTDTTGETTQTTAVTTLLPGDVNCDGKVTVSDAILLARVVAEDQTAEVSKEGKLNADMNQNGAPDSDDIVMVLKVVAGIA